MLRNEKRAKEENNKAAMNAPSASLRSENSEMKSAVEMTPRGKRGKLKNTKAPDFHISTAPATAYLTQKGQNMKPKLNSS